MSSSKRKREPVIDLGRRDGDVGDGSGGDGRAEEGMPAAALQKEGQVKQGAAPPKEVVEVVLDRGGASSKEEIKYGTQQGGLMEDDKQSAADHDGDEVSDDGVGTGAEDKHMVEAAAGDGNGNHTSMAHNEVCCMHKLN